MWEFSLVSHLSEAKRIFYILIIALSFFAPDDFIPTAFDSGGVTTGPITVPFIMALGAGLASNKKGKLTGEHSFGLVSLCSIGPILSVLLLSVFYKPKSATTVYEIADVLTTTDAFKQFTHALTIYAKEVALAFIPLVIFFVVFQLITRRYHIHNIVKMSVGFVYTYIGLVMFLTGATGGTVIKGRLADTEQFADLPDTTVEEDREILCILAPFNASKQIMEDVNKNFGLTSSANGIVFAVPTEKAYKI